MVGRVPPLPAGGPHRIVVNGGPAPVENVYAGEVWLCAGQSNMEFGMLKLGGANGPPGLPPDLSDYRNPLLRLWTAGSAAAARPARAYAPAPPVGEAPRESFRPWTAADAEGLARSGHWGGFSAVAFYFGRRVQETTGRPVGLLQAACGGTPIEAWWSPWAVAEARRRGLAPVVPGYAEAVAQRAAGEPNATDPRHAVGASFNGQVAPMLPLALKGVVWYQGERNAIARDRQYADKLRLLIEDWRRVFAQPDLPFLLVQLSNWRHPSPAVQKEALWHLVREAQAEVARADPRVGLAVAVDLANRGRPADETDIHPRDKRSVGERLARLAERMVYGLDTPASGPVFLAMETGGAAARLRFDPGAAGGLVARGGTLEGFRAAGADRAFRPASARIEGDTVVVTAGGVASPVAVRYQFESFCDPPGTLYNAEGLPAAPFRTDDWPVP